MITCLRPPSSDYLLDLILHMIESKGDYNDQATAEAFNTLSLHMRHHKPEKQWMLILLSAMDDGHEIF